MDSFSSLCFLVSIFRLSSRTAGITFLSASGGSRAIFYGPCLFPCLKQFSCLCCSLEFCCYILSLFQCLSLNRLEACARLCLLKNLPLIMYVEHSLISLNIDANRIVFVYQCLERALKDLLIIHCRR